MTRQTFQQGYVSEPIKTRRGTAFKIRYRLRTGEGKWKHKAETLYGLAGRKAARAILAQRVQEASVEKPELSELTFQDFVESYWKPYLDRKGIKPSTEQGYRCILNNHILPTFGPLHLVKIAPMQIEEFLKIKTVFGRSAKTVRNMIVILQGIFSLAQENDLIVQSPVRRKHKPLITRQEKPVWKAEQVRKIIGAVPELFRVLLTTIALTGLRVGELLALQWKHVDFEAHRLRVDQSLWQGQLVATKTASSTRVIPLGDFLSRQLTDYLQHSAHIGPDDFVFSKSSGEPLNPDVLRRDVLYPALDRLGIPRAKRSAGFHTFRHSAASFLNEQTGNLKLAQKFLGHADIGTTANIYTHTSDEAEHGAAVAIERAIFGDLFPTVPKTGNRNSDRSPE